MQRWGRIETVGLELDDMLTLARRFGCSASDTACLALAETTGQPLLTGDRRLYNMAHAALGWIVWIEGFEG